MKENLIINKKINERDFIFIPVSHMEKKSFYTKIESVLENNPRATIIKEGRAENNEYLKDEKNKSRIETIFAHLIYAQRKKMKLIAEKLDIDFVLQSENLDEKKYGQKIIEPDILLVDFGNHLKKFFRKDNLEKALVNEKSWIKAINSKQIFSKEEKEVLFNMINKSISPHKPKNKNVSEIQKPRSELLLNEVIKQSLLDIDDSVIVIYGKQHIDYILGEM